MFSMCTLTLTLICNIQKFPLNSDTSGDEVSCSEQPVVSDGAHTLTT